MIYPYSQISQRINLNNLFVVVFIGLATKEGDEIFSDPDIHVSKKNKYPKENELVYVSYINLNKI